MVAEPTALFAAPSRRRARRGESNAAPPRARGGWVPAPWERGIAGNICRCGTYQNIFEAVARAARSGGTGGR